MKLSQLTCHGVWKSQKKSHSSLRAKRAKFTFWVDKNSSKMPKNVNFGQFLKNVTFWVIFKHCAVSMFFFRLSRASAGWTQEQKNVKRKGYLFPREEMFIDSSPNAIFCLLRFFPRQRWPLATKNLSIMATLKNKIQFGFNFIISWQIHLCFGESSR